MVTDRVSSITYDYHYRLISLNISDRHVLIHNQISLNYFLLPEDFWLIPLPRGLVGSNYKDKDWNYAEFILWLIIEVLIYTTTVWEDH